jgi:hypothetical protein
MHLLPCSAGGVLAVLTADSLGRRRGTTLGCLLSAACYVAVALIIKLVYFDAGGVRQLDISWAWAVGALISLACVSALGCKPLTLASECWAVRAAVIGVFHYGTHDTKLSCQQQLPCAALLLLCFALRSNTATAPKKADTSYFLLLLLLLLQGLDFAANTLLWVFSFEVQPLPTRSLATGIVTAWHSLQVRQQQQQPATTTALA